MNRKNTGGPVPDWKLERYLLGELPPGEVEAIRGLTLEDTELQGRVETLGQSGAEILERYPPAWMSRRIEQRSRKEAVSRTRGGRSFARVPGWIWPVPALVAAFLLMVLPARQVIDDAATGPAGSGAEVRIKGMEPQLMLYRKTSMQGEGISGSERLQDRQEVRPGDVVQIVYWSGGRGYGAILSIDGRGSLTWHLPPDGGEAARLQEGRVPLEFAYELDEAPEFERFYFITADAPFQLGKVAASAVEGASRVRDRTGTESKPADLDSLNLPRRLSQFMITLSKGPDIE